MYRESLEVPECFVVQNIIKSCRMWNGISCRRVQTRKDDFIMASPTVTLGNVAYVVFFYHFNSSVSLVMRWNFQNSCVRDIISQQCRAIHETNNLFTVVMYFEVKHI